MSVKHLYLIAVPMIVACAPTPGTSGTSGSPTPRSTTVLAAQEMQAVNLDVGTAYDAISRLRPNWLTRGTTSYDPPTTERPIVFVDGRRYGELDSLRSLDASHIAEIRFYTAAEAGGRFGMQGGLSGVIEVTMKK
jgi:hypothetical protein